VSQTGGSFPGKSPDVSVVFRRRGEAVGGKRALKKIRPHVGFSPVKFRGAKPFSSAREPGLFQGEKFGSTSVFRAKVGNPLGNGPVHSRKGGSERGANHDTAPQWAGAALPPKL